jgi:TRAP-type uncharacterized transport system fused permease subunit
MFLDLLLLQTHWLERYILIASGVLLAYPSSVADLAGFIGFGVVLVTQYLRNKKSKLKPIL